jgi:hypothetical protein
MLTDISVAYSNPRYIADEIFPTVMVDKQTDIVPEYDKSHWFRDMADRISEGGTAPFAGFDVTTTTTYYCDRFGLRYFISDDQRANQDDPFNIDRDATKWVTDRLMLRRERSFVSDFWSTSVWTTDITGGSTVNKWSDFGTSDPIVDVRTYKRTVRRLIGRDPNCLVLGDLTYDKLLDHPDVLDRIKYTERGIATQDLLASMFGLSKVLVGTSVYTADEEGLAEASVTLSANWDDDALLLYVPDNPMLMEPAAGYTFVWRTSSNAGGGPQWMRKYRDEERMGDVVEVRSYYDQKSLVADAGAFFSGIAD